MARYTGPVCRLCRREGMKLFLKGDRCFTEKCAIEKRNYAPGQHGKGGRIKSKLQGYGLQLREKQKVKRLYRMQEGQFGLTFDRAAAGEGRRGRGAARASWSAGWTTWSTGSASAASRDQARQLVRHGHVKVNDKKVNIPSYQVNEGDVVTPRLPRGQERAGRGVRRGGEGPRRAQVAGAGRRRHEGPRAVHARPRRRELPDPGTAHRRAVLQVVGNVTARLPTTEERARDAPPLAARN